MDFSKEDLELIEIILTYRSDKKIIETLKLENQTNETNQNNQTNEGNGNYLFIMRALLIAGVFVVKT